MPEVGQWLASLVLLIAVAMTAGLYPDKQAEGTRFWLLVPAVLCFAWFAIFIRRLLVWASLDNRASNRDKMWEDFLLREISRGRRALQILHAGIAIPLPDSETRPPKDLQMLMQKR